MKSEGAVSAPSGAAVVSEGKVFTVTVIGSIATFSVISSICLMWLYTQVIYPTLTSPLQFDNVGLVSLFFDLLIAVLILIAMVFNSLDLMTTAALRIRKPQMSKSVPKVRRFTLNETIQHLTLIATTGISALTGFALMFYSSWGKSVTNDLGGFEQTINIHYASAIIMGVLVAYHFGYYGSKYIANKLLKQEARFDINIFRKKDMTDFFASIKFYLGRGDKPKFAKYSFAQKFDYWGIYWGMVILGLPGLMIWAGGIQTYGGLAFVFHVKEALLAVLFLGVFHFYQVHFTPRQFPGDFTLFTGVVSEQEVEEDHPLMLEKP